jgi:hypothetical protein
MVGKNHVRQHGTLRDGLIPRSASLLSLTACGWKRTASDNSSKNSNCSTSKPQGRKNVPPAKDSPSDTATASRWWLIHYPDSDPLEVACCPEATHAEILERHPDAIAAEPFAPTMGQPLARMTGEQEIAIRACWH